MSVIAVIGAAFGLATAVGGVLSLHVGWRRRPHGPWLVGGWALLVLGFLGWAATAGLDEAAALALLVPSLVAYGVLAAKVELKRRKPRRPPKSAVELAEASNGHWRLLVRTLYAGPLSGAAAVGGGAAVALHAPLGEADRLIAGGMLVPVIWGVGMIWATTDVGLARIGLGLGTGAALMFAAATL